VDAADAPVPPPVAPPLAPREPAADHAPRSAAHRLRRGGVDRRDGRGRRRCGRDAALPLPPPSRPAQLSA
jgi:hypothetical protein